MTVKTSELTGAALDWAVAKCEEMLHLDNAESWLRDYRIGFSTRYSAVWSAGGEIIEREKIDTRNTFTEGGYRTSKSIDAVEACIRLPNGATAYAPAAVLFEYGPSPLIAAMRCYVASKLGDTVEIPDELML